MNLAIQTYCRPFSYSLSLANDNLEVSIAGVTFPLVSQAPWRAIYTNRERMAYVFARISKNCSPIRQRLHSTGSEAPASRVRVQLQLPLNPTLQFLWLPYRT